MQRLERLLDGRILVKAVDLIEVEVVRPQALQAGVDTFHDVLATESARVGAGSHGIEDFRRDDVVIPLGVFRQPFPGYHFAFPGRICISRIEEIDAEIEGFLEVGTGPFLVDHVVAIPLAAVTHATKHHAADL